LNTFEFFTSITRSCIPCVVKVLQESTISRIT